MNILLSVNIGQQMKLILHKKWRIQSGRDSSSLGAIIVISLACLSRCLLLHWRWFLQWDLEKIVHHEVEPILKEKVGMSKSSSIIMVLPLEAREINVESTT